MIATTWSYRRKKHTYDSIWIRLSSNGSWSFKRRTDKAILKVFERNHCFLSLTTEYGNLLYLLLGGCHEFKLNQLFVTS